MKCWKQSVLSVLVCVGLLYLPDEVKASDLVCVGGPYVVIDVSGGPEAEVYPSTYFKSAQDIPHGVTNDLYKTTSLLLRRISAGTFMMGSPQGELGRDDDETQRQVTLTKDFYIGVYQVTQKQWERVMGDWPSCFNNPVYRDSRPLESRSWNDIRGGTWPGGQPASGTFMQRIRIRTGLNLDLPTEAQWEYTCRAGTTTALNSVKNIMTADENMPCPHVAEVGRYKHNHPGGYSVSEDVSARGGTAKVGSYVPNAWGLYDMHGNIWEWCLDGYTESPSGKVDPVGGRSGSERVSRGGGWDYVASFCRSAARLGDSPDDRDEDFSFRLSLTLP